MPRKNGYELVCVKCGRKFTVMLSDAIMPKDAELLKNPVCKLCRMKSIIRF